MRKRMLAALFALVFTLALLPAAALAQHETTVECYHEKCPGYCYVYDEPSSMTGRNLGRMDNGTRVTVYSRSDGWCYISGYNKKGSYIYGYVHWYSLADPGTDDSDYSGGYIDDRDDDWEEDREEEHEEEHGGGHGGGSYEQRYVECYHEKCPGYCYVYDRASSVTGRNLGRMDNGTPVTVYNYVSNNQGGWYYIGGYNTKGEYIYGYVHSYSLN